MSDKTSELLDLVGGVEALAAEEAARAREAYRALLLRLAASDAARPLILAVAAGVLSSRWLARPRRPATATKATATDDDHRHPRRRSRSCGPGVGRR